MKKGPKEEELAEWLGSDVVEELFGKPDETPSTLLWLANSLYNGITHFTSLFVSDSPSNSPIKSNKIN